MGKVPGYKVRIRGSRRELVWKGDEEDEKDLGMVEDMSGPPDMRIRASRRELVWDADEGNDEVEEKEEDEEGARRKEEDLYYGGQKIKHFKSKDELPNSRVSPLIIYLSQTMNSRCIASPKIGNKFLSPAPPKKQKNSTIPLESSYLTNFKCVPSGRRHGIPRGRKGGNRKKE